MSAQLELFITWLGIFTVVAWETSFFLDWLRSQIDEDDDPPPGGTKCPCKRPSFCSAAFALRFIKRGVRYDSTPDTRMAIYV